LLVALGKNDKSKLNKVYLLLWDLFKSLVKPMILPLVLMWFGLQKFLFNVSYNHKNKKIFI